MKTAAIGVAAFSLLLGGCNTFSKTYPSNGSVVPNAQFHLTPGYTLALEKLVYWGGVAAIAYYVTDPLSPNWDITEAQFPNDHYRLSLQMKRFYIGGAGEARVIFNRRADELMRDGNFDGYKILDYSEGLESSVLGSQRNAEGTILLTRSAALQNNELNVQGSAPPARSTAASVENPRS